jgi:type I restriction enzyme S subunit
MAASKPTAEQLITDNIDVWTSAIKKRGSQGRGSSKKIKFQGITVLRKLILGLAVEGKLTTQNPSDKTVGEILKHPEIILRQKTKGRGVLVDLDKIVEEVEKKFNLPIGWEWSRLGKVVEVTGGSQPPKSVFRFEELEGYTRLIQIRDFKSDNFLTYVPDEFANRPFVETDILIGRYGPPVFQILRGKKGTYNVALMKAEPVAGAVLNDYLFYLLSEPRIQDLVISESERTAGQSGVRKELIYEFPIALPPIAEQKEIVAKVSELMALCDQLEQQTESSLTAHQTLVETLLNTLLTAAQTAGTKESNSQSNSNQESSFDQAWNRIAQHFDELFTTEHSIDQLKQTILQLAVMGKLIPQDPSDEPASVLLNRIDAVKDQLERKGELKTKAKYDIDENEKYIQLRDGWSYLRLGNLAKFIDYRGKTPNKITEGIPLITAKNIKYGYISREPAEFISKEDYVDWMTRGFPRIGDVLFTTEAPLGNVALIDICEDFALAQRSICFQMHEPLMAPFLVYLIMSNNFQMQLKDKATGMTASGIKASKLKEIPVPLPPLKEQFRIVAKIDELMLLCDILKKGISESQTTQLHLADAMAEKALN